jgi:predicted permease
MATLREWMVRLWGTLRSRRADRDLESELRIHMEFAMEDARRAADSRDELRAAVIESRSTAQAMEALRDQRGLPWIDDVLRDVRHALRLLRRDPGFAIVAILSLALGIGANTAIFQLMDAVQFRTLPVRAAQNLVEVQSTFRRWGNATGRRPLLTFAIWDRLRVTQEAFSGLFAWGTNRFDLSDAGESRLIDGLWVSGEFFNVLGVPAVLGRVFTTRDDERSCGSPGVVISHAFWQREYGGDPSVVGRTIRLDAHPFEIVGVTPAHFFGVEVGRTFDVAVPLCAEPLLEPARNAVDKRHYWWLDVIGRLKPDWTLERADAHLAAISLALMAETVAPQFPSEIAKQYQEAKLSALSASTGVSYLRGRYAQPLWVLLAVAALVLLIACANLANLMLARATAREREIAVRLALGATRARVVRQMLAESLLLAVLGAAFGVLLAGSFSGVLVSLISTDTSHLFFDLQSNWRVLAFTVGLAASACLLFGLAPAVRATRQSAGAAMKTGGRGTTDARERFGLRRVLVVVQVALSLVLIVGALLFVRTVRNLATVDTGMRTDSVLVADFDTRPARVPPERQVAFEHALRDRIAAVPGVVGAVDVAISPLGGSGWNDHVIVDGVTQQTNTDENRLSPGFFKMLETKFIVGRDFDDRDTAAAPPVAIVNEAFADTMFHTRNAIGRTFRQQVAPGETSPVFQVVGVVANTKYSDVRDPLRPLAYFPEAQVTNPEPTLTEVQVLVRTAVTPVTVTSAVTAAAREVSPAILVSYRTIEQDIRRSFLRERMMAIISGFFGALAALIAMIGLYGVMSYMVARRKNEIGIRMALGADRGDVLRLILGDASRLLVIGLVAGAGAAVAAAQAANTLLFGLTPHDPATLALASVSLGAVAMLASCVPAFRASRLAPTIALREE